MWIMGGGDVDDVYDYSDKKLACLYFILKKNLGGGSLKNTDGHHLYTTAGAHNHLI